jgi:Tol biopolymer transport system component
MTDDAGVVQLFTVSPLGGEPTQITRDEWHVASAFSWSPDGTHLAYIADGSVMMVDVRSGVSSRLTEAVHGVSSPRPEACVFSPDGSQIAYVRTMPDVTTAGSPANAHNQIFVVDIIN